MSTTLDNRFRRLEVALGKLAAEMVALQQRIVLLEQVPPKRPRGRPRKDSYQPRPLERVTYGDLD